MKLLYNLVCFAIIHTSASLAQPAGYYNNAYGKSGEALRASLYGIIKGHTSLNYGGSTLPNTWTAFQSTDKKPNGKVWDIYSDKPGGTPPYEYDFTQQCGNGQNHENSCFNHEHVWPQSLFSQNLPMRSDLWIVYPTDYYVNGQRGDMPYGVVATPTKTFQNGAKIGSQAYPGAPSATAFEPVDSFKGDIARSYFYISTRYYADSGQFQSWDMAYHTRLKPWVIQMLLAWHRADPVSGKEKERNEAVYAIQNNRNPFIDDPRFAECIWAGNCAGLSVPTLAGIRLRVTPNPAVNSVSIDWQSIAPDEVLAVDVLDMQGRYIFHASRPLHAMIISVLEWPSGCYVVRLKTQQGVRVEKLSVQ